MTKTCVICKKQPIPGDFIRSFHRFPTNSGMKQKWMKTIGTEEIKTVSTVCSDHFGDDSYHQTNGYTKTRRLLSTAVPRITNNVVSDFSISVDTSSCIDESDVSQNFLTEMICDTQPKDTETTNDKKTMNSKRKRPITDESNLTMKKFCFMDDHQPSQILREDFVSDEAWERFIKLMKYKNSQIITAKF